MQNGGLDINGKGVHSKVVGGPNGEFPNSARNPAVVERENTQQLNETLHSSSGAYINRTMLNGSAYNSPNLTNNRRELFIQERVPGDGSFLNPDIVPSEKLPSIQDNHDIALDVQEQNQNSQSKQNQKSWFGRGWPRRCVPP